MLPESVLITGTSRGIGLELVRQLSAHPSPPKHIFATCRSPGDAQELQHLAKQYECIKVIQFDVTDFESYEKLVSTVENVVGERGLNLLFNNAGISGHHSLEEVTAAAMIDVYKTSTVAPVMLAKAFLPLLRRASNFAVTMSGIQGTDMGVCRAAVITASSKVASFQLFDTYRQVPHFPTRAAKAAVNMTVCQLARDLETDGILVVALNPGWVKTPMGGPEAPLTVEESVNNMLQTIERLDKSAHGLHINSNGEIVPW